MHQAAPPRPKLAETVIEPTVKLRQATIGRCCEVLGDTAIEYTELGDYSYLGPGCMVADAQIGRFCAIAPRCASARQIIRSTARRNIDLPIVPSTTRLTRSGTMTSFGSDAPIAS
jgi:hypothetical protein